MVDVLDREALSDLIGLIYDCSVDASRWSVTLSALSRALDFQNAGLSWVDFVAAHTLLDVSVGIEDSWRRTQHDYDAEALALWGSFEALQRYPLGEPQVMSSVAGRPAIERSAYYREWGRPQGLIDLVALPLVRTPSTIGNIAMGRGQAAGPVGGRELDALRLLSPHFQRALAIGKLFDLKALEIHAFGETLNGLATPVVLVDPDLVVLSANRAAETLLAASQGIRLVEGMLTSGTEATDSALRAAVRPGDAAKPSRHGLGIPVRNGAPAALIHVLPLTRGGLRDGLSPRATAAVFVARMSDGQLPAAEALAALFELTAAEARVFALLAAGRTQQQISAALGIAPGTVKTHLLRVFAKTGTNRQADLVRLANTLAMPL
jgi:DNA-binding CsgD family transcriptional regulator/PAS domain-containing protein